MEDIVIFRLGKQDYGLPVTYISEIVQMVAVTELPNLPQGMLGIINYRGDVIPLLDLRQIYDTPVQNIQLNSLIMVAKSRCTQLGMLVDGVKGVIPYPETDYPPAANQQRIKAILKTDNSVILMIDLDALAEIVEPLVSMFV